MILRGARRARRARAGTSRSSAESIVAFERGADPPAVEAEPFERGRLDPVERVVAPRRRRRATSRAASETPSCPGAAPRRAGAPCRALRGAGAAGRKAGSSRTVARRPRARPRPDRAGGPGSRCRRTRASRRRRRGGPAGTARARTRARGRRGRRPGAAAPRTRSRPTSMRDLGIEQRHQLAAPEDRRRKRVLAAAIRRASGWYPASGSRRFAGLDLLEQPVALVAAEQLVAALSRVHDADAGLRGGAGEVELRQSARTGERPSERAHERRQHLERVGRVDRDLEQREARARRRRRAREGSRPATDRPRGTSP